MDLRGWQETPKHSHSASSDVPGVQVPTGSICYFHNRKTMQATSKKKLKEEFTTELHTESAKSPWVPRSGLRDSGQGGPSLRAWMDRSKDRWVGGQMSGWVLA